MNQLNPLSPTTSMSPRSPVGMQRATTPTQFSNTSSVTRRRDTYPFIDPFRFRGSLTGKIALIPNASRGVGKASALAFASAGATVVLTSRNMAVLQPVMAEIQSRYGTPAYALSADFSDSSIPTRLVQHVESSLGQIDILLNVITGAAITAFCHETDFLGNWWSAMERQVRTPIALIHAVLPGMIARGQGTIISTCSPNGVLHIPFTTSDSTARAALIRFHTGLHHEIAPKGIKSFIVSPGMIASYLHDPSMESFSQATPTPYSNPLHFQKEPRMEEELTSQFGRATGNGWASVGLASGTFVALCADERAAVLSGLYIDAERDLGEVIAQAELGDNGRIAQEKLYVLKVDEL